MKKLILSFIIFLSLTGCLCAQTTSCWIWNSTTNSWVWNTSCSPATTTVPYVPPNGYVDSANYSTVAAAISAATAVNGGIWLDSILSFTGTQNVTVPIFVVPNKGYILQAGSGTLTFSVQPQAPPVQWLTTFTAGQVTGLTTAYPEWWGTGATALQSAMAAGYHVILQNNTTYTTGANVITLNNQTIEGAGWGSVVQATNGTFNIFTPSGVITGFIAKNFNILGGSTVTDASQNQWAFLTDATGDSLDHSLFSHLYIGSTAGTTGLNDGIKFDNGSDYNEVDSVFFYKMMGAGGTGGGDVGYGILSGPANYANIHDCTYIGDSTHGRHFVYTSGSYWDIHDNHIWNSPNCAIHIRATSAEPTVVMTVAHNNDIHTTYNTNALSAAIQIYGNTQDCQAIDNIVDGGGADGIGVDNYSTGGENIRTIVKGNKVTNSGNYGINITGAQNAIIEDNYVATSGLVATHTYANLYVGADGNDGTNSIGTVIKGNTLVATTWLHDNATVWSGAIGTVWGVNQLLGAANTNPGLGLNSGVYLKYPTDMVVLAINRNLLSNTSTGETTLQTYALQPGQMAIANDVISWEIMGNTANNSNNKEVKVYFGNTVIWDSGSIAANNVSWSASGTILNVTSSGNSQTAFSTGNFNGSTIVMNRTPGETLSNSITLKVTGQGGATGDVSQLYMKVWYQHQPALNGL